MESLRDKVAHLLMGETMDGDQSMYDVADSILAIPEIAEALRACEEGGELDVYRANREFPD